jgi:hypothetical protein
LCGQGLLDMQCKRELRRGMGARCACVGVPPGVNMIPGVIPEGSVCSETRYTGSRGWGGGGLLLAPINMAVGIVCGGSSMPRAPPPNVTVHPHDPQARAGQPQRRRNPTRCPHRRCPLLSPPDVPTCRQSGPPRTKLCHSLVPEPPRVPRGRGPTTWRVWRKRLPRHCALTTCRFWRLFSRSWQVQNLGRATPKPPPHTPTSSTKLY